MRFSLLIRLLAIFLTTGTAVAQDAPPMFGQDTKLGQPEFFDSRDEVRTSAIPLADSATPGSDFAIAVVFEMNHGWHIWTQPRGRRDGVAVFTTDGTAVFSTAINTEVSAAIADDVPITIHTDETVWPEAHLVEMDVGEGLQEYAVFEGRAVAIVPVTINDSADPGTYEVVLKLTFQACETQCLRPVYDLEVPVSISIVAGDPVDASTLGFTGDFDRLDAAIFDDLAHSPAKVNDDASPESTTPDTTDATSAAGEPTPQRARPTFFGWELPEFHGWAGLALLAVLSMLGGFILNLTPCVLPVIPIKIMTISQHAGSPGRSVILGLWMAVGVIMFWVAIGVPVAFVSGITDPSRIFGIWWVTFSIGLLITLMGIGIMGMFSIQLPQSVYAINPKADTAWGSFLFGVMTAVLGLPCFGFVAGALLAGAATLPAATIMTIFTALGVGMAAPYFVLSAKPSLVAKIPRTGPASELVKQVMGLLLLAAGAYFVGSGLIALVSDMPWLGRQLHWWAVAIFSASAGIWLIVRIATISKRVMPTAVFGVLGLAIAVVGVGVAVNSTGKARNVYEKQQIALAEAGGGQFTTTTWSHYTPAAFARAREEGYIVVLDFTAEWCATCQYLKSAVLDRDPVRSELERIDVVFFLVDNTSNNAPGWTLLRELGQAGIPTLAVYSPNDDDPWVANAYTSDQVVAAISKARTTQVAQR